jgi:hypothetical protein
VRLRKSATTTPTIRANIQQARAHLSELVPEVCVTIARCRPPGRCSNKLKLAVVRRRMRPGRVGYQLPMFPAARASRLAACPPHAMINLMPATNHPALTDLAGPNTCD